MEISAKKYEQLVTGNAYLTIVEGLHARNKDYMVPEVLDIVTDHKAVQNSGVLDAVERIFEMADTDMESCFGKDNEDGTAACEEN